MAEVRWAWLFLDCPPGDSPEGHPPAAWAWWAEATGTTVSPVRGERGQFATLLPSEGDPWVKVQATLDGPASVHLDLDVDDVHSAAASAEALGATRVGAIGQSVVVLRSPGGFGFCLTTKADTPAAAPPRQVRTGPVLLDQVMLDTPSSLFEAEARFWSALTGWGLVSGSAGEFAVLTRPDGIPVRLLLQRVGREGSVTGHVDLACADRPTAVAEHLSAGAQVRWEGARWTVLNDPFGRTYCLTDRDPATGVLPVRGAVSR